MRTVLIVIGVVLLALGGVVYFMPTQTAVASTTTVAGDGTDTRTSYATLRVPLQIALASSIAGFILFVLGLILPGSGNVSRKAPEGSHIVRMKEYIRTGDGNKRNVVREKREEHIKRTVTN